MTESASASKPWYGDAGAAGDIIKGAGSAVGSSFQGAAQTANSKKEAKEAKRRTLANLLNSSLKRNRSLFRTGQDYQDDMTDFQTQALQQMARGFVDSLQGRT